MAKIKVGNEYFKRTKQKIVGSLAVAKELHKKFTHCMVKLDGTHAELIIGNNTVQFITRGGIDVTHLVPYLVSSFNSFALLEAYRGVYACELVHLDKVLNDSKDCLSASRRVLGCDKYNPNEPELQCVIYDVHSKVYVDVPQDNYFARRMMLPKVNDWRSNQYAKYVDPCIDLPNVYVPTMFDISMATEIWEKEIINRGCEGLMCVNLDNRVAWDKTFTKVKPLIDVDCVVMGFIKGTEGTKNEGKVGSILVGVYKEDVLVPIGKVPHMTELQRDYWTDRMRMITTDCYDVQDNTKLFMRNPKGDYVIQVECAEITKAFKLRFPNYVTDRKDKEAQECLWEQIV